MLVNNAGPEQICSLVWVYAGRIYDKVGIYMDNSLTLSVRQIKPNTCANSVDADDTARYEPSHQDLHCLLFCF